MRGAKRLACAVFAALVLHLLLLLAPFPFKPKPETTHPVSEIWLQPPAIPSIPSLPAEQPAAAKAAPDLEKTPPLRRQVQQAAGRESSVADIPQATGMGAMPSVLATGHAKDGTFIPGSEITRPPICQRDPRPELPAISRSLGEEGSVRLRLRIGADGIIRSVAAVKSSGYDRLDEVARKTLLQWHCQPALRHGEPVAAELEETVVFELK